MTTEDKGNAAAGTGEASASGAGSAAGAADAGNTNASAGTAGTTNAGASGEATAAAAAEEQKVPLSRLQAVIAQKAESERAREALARELKLANDTLEEFRNLGQRGSDSGRDGTNAAASANNGTAAQVRTDARAAKPLSPEELQRLVNEESQRQQFDKRCNDAVADGRKAHADFDKVVLGDLSSISPVLDQRSGRPVLPTPLVEAALETGNAPEVLYALGQDISEASRIMALRPVAQAVELAKFAAKLLAKQDDAAAGDMQVSRAPAPIKSPTKSGSVKPAFNIYDTDNFDTKEWIRQREKQLADSRANR